MENTQLELRANILASLMELDEMHITRNDYASRKSILMSQFYETLPQISEEQFETLKSEARWSKDFSLRWNCLLYTSPSPRDS